MKKILIALALISTSGIMARWEELEHDRVEREWGLNKERDFRAGYEGQLDWDSRLLHERGVDVNYPGVAAYTKRHLVSKVG